MICLGATHYRSRLQRAILYTIVIRHYITGSVYIHKEDHFMAVVGVFLRFVKNDIGIASLTKKTIDVSAAEHAAINAVYLGSLCSVVLVSCQSRWDGQNQRIGKAWFN